jgi:LPLT family lysophospholipid transporter-like MFS transporter
MTRGLTALLSAQFLSAFGDNAILFAAIGMVLQAAHTADWYIPALQSVFLVAYVIAAPWVGPFADRLPKPRVLMIANLVKAGGVGLILAGVEPLLAYALVGLGAAIYSPAKYGILPEMVAHGQLVRANAWIEASTIGAIILGTAAGGQLADVSVTGAFWLVAASYLVSLLLTFLIPATAPRGGSLRDALPQFSRTTRAFMQSARARFAMLGGSLFWGAAAVLRVLLVAWAPLVLASRSAGDISELVLYLAVGVVVGSAVVPRIIPLEQLRRARLAAYAMGVAILLFGLVDTAPQARVVLFLIGLAGGVFIVPINAALQHIGFGGVGSGRAVAVQNFFQNVAMLITVGIYTAATAFKVQPVTAVIGLGVGILAATLLLSQRLPAVAGKSDVDDPPTQAGPG